MLNSYIFKLLRELVWEIERQKGRRSFVLSLLKTRRGPWEVNTVVGTAGHPQEAGRRRASSWNTGRVRCELRPLSGSGSCSWGPCAPSLSCRRAPGTWVWSPAGHQKTALTLKTTSPVAPERPGECTPRAMVPGIMGGLQAAHLGLEDPHGLGRGFSGWG